MDDEENLGQNIFISNQDLNQSDKHSLLTPAICLSSSTSSSQSHSVIYYQNDQLSQVQYNTVNTNPKITIINTVVF